MEALREKKVKKFNIDKIKKGCALKLKDKKYKKNLIALVRNIKPNEISLKWLQREDGFTGGHFSPAEFVTNFEIIEKMDA